MALEPQAYLDSRHNPSPRSMPDLAESMSSRLYSGAESEEARLGSPPVARSRATFLSGILPRENTFVHGRMIGWTLLMKLINVGWLMDQICNNISYPKDHTCCPGPRDWIRMAMRGIGWRCAFNRIVSWLGLRRSYTLTLKSGRVNPTRVGKPRKSPLEVEWEI